MTQKEAIKIILKEFIIKKKPLGDGSFKVVYPMQSNPKYVIKQIIPPTHPIRVTNEERNRATLEPEVQFYEDYPDLFAKIIKVNYEKGYMIQERLDTNLFATNIKSLVKEFAKHKKLKFNKNDDDEFLYVQEFISRYWDLIEETYKGKNEFIDKLLKFISGTNSAYFSNLTRLGLDLKTNNIGMDSSGNIKLLDI